MVKATDLNKGLTLKYLKENIFYNPDTGEFFRNKKGKHKIGTLHKKGYIVIGLDYKRYMAHRLAWFYVYNEWPNETIDHINRNKLDNRIVNLRKASYTENNHNVGIIKTNTSGYKGVNFHKGKFRAYISKNNKHNHLGTYNTLKEARKRYIIEVKNTRKKFGKI